VLGNHERRAVAFYLSIKPIALPAVAERGQVAVLRNHDSRASAALFVESVYTVPTPAVGARSRIFGHGG
jgi:hypothetical protein